MLSGGRLISGWRETTIAGKKLWVAELPKTANTNWSFHELWVNGVQGIRARHPNSGYLQIAALPDKPAEWTQGQSRFEYREGDLKPSATLTNGEVVAMTRWVESRLPISVLDESKHIISFRKRSVFELAPKDFYYVEGVLEFLDAPGEWYLDENSRKVYYLPRPGEVAGKTEAVAPYLSQVVRMNGEPQPSKFIENLHVAGITFAHTEWYFPAGFHSKNKPEIDRAQTRGRRFWAGRDRRSRSNLG